MTFPVLLRRPSAFLPLAMSAAALILLLAHVAVIGVAAARQPDEGATAHLFQLLIVAEVPLVAIFASTWLRRAPRLGVAVLALQAAAVMVALAPVYFFNL